MRRWPAVLASVAVINLSFAAAFLLVIFVGLTLVNATREASGAAALVRHTEEVLLALGDVRESFARVDSAQRGYLLGGAPAYLQDRDRWAQRLQDGAAKVEMLTRDNGQQHARSGQLAGLVRQRLALAAENSRLRDATGSGAIPGSQLELSQELTDRLLATTSAMQDEERRLLSQRQAMELERQRHTSWLVAGVFALFLLILVPAYLGVLHQSRSRKRVERQMTELVEQLPLTLWQFRRQPKGGLQFLYVGGRAGQDRGVPAEALLRDGDTLFSNVLEEDRAGLRAATRHAERSLEPLDAEYRVAMPGDGIKWIRSAATLRRQPDGATLWTGYWKDITAQKELEQALQQATDEANRANRAKSTFLATMSHEIRTPMNGVLGLLELLSLSRLDSEQRATLDVVSESGRGLLRIIDDILDFSKVEAGRLALNPLPASVPELVKRACQIHSGIASSRGLLLQQFIDPCISPALVFDPLRVGQILNNFISNALKFTSEGSVTVSVDSLSRDEARERLRFTVQDTGIGLSADSVAGLFEPFAQADSGVAASFGGTGLGLAICKRLAAMMDGHVSLQSRQGAGTTVMLEVAFPVAPATALPDPESENAPPRQLSRAVATRRLAPHAGAAEAEGSLVLVVDDHPTNRLVLSRQVAALGYGLLLAENGLQALDLWRTRRIGLLLTDCNMPELSGYDLARTIREEESEHGRPRTPIVACTANALGNEAARCLAAGMDDFLIKPVNLVDLMRRLDQWLPLPAGEALAPHEAQDAGALLDPQALASITGGDPVVQREVLLDFRQVNDADLSLLRSEMTGGDPEQVLHLAHRIKGAARTIGAQRLTACCDQLELATRSANPGEPRRAFEQLEQEVHSLNRHIDEITAAVIR